MEIHILPRKPTGNAAWKTVTKTRPAAKTCSREIPLAGASSFTGTHNILSVTFSITTAVKIILNTRHCIRAVCHRSDHLP